MRTSCVLVLLGVSIGGGSCAPRPVGFDSPDPAGRLDAIRRAAATDDRSTMPALVNQLDSDDPVVRLAAIRTLERFTGTTLGYEHADPPWERDQAIGRWRRYLAAGAPEAAGQPPSPARDASAATAGSGRP